MSRDWALILSMRNVLCKSGALSVGGWMDDGEWAEAITVAIMPVGSAGRPSSTLGMYSMCIEHLLLLLRRRGKRKEGKRERGKEGKSYRALDNTSTACILPRTLSFSFSRRPAALGMCRVLCVEYIMYSTWMERTLAAQPRRWMPLLFYSS